MTEGFVGSKALLEGIDLSKPHRGAIVDSGECHYSLVLSDTPVPHRQPDGSAKMRWRAVIMSHGDVCLHELGQIVWLDDPKVTGSIALAEGFQAKFAGFVGKMFRIMPSREAEAHFDNPSAFTTGRDFVLEYRQQGNWVSLPAFVARASVIIDVDQPTSLNVILVDGGDRGKEAAE